MTARSYYAPEGGLPPQTQLLTDRAVFTEAYAVIPKGTMRDIVTSFLPFWDKTRAWVIARPLSGFAETFSQYIMEVRPGGGSERPETDASAEAVLFVVGGALTVTLKGVGFEPLMLLRLGSIGLPDISTTLTAEDASGAYSN